MNLRGGNFSPYRLPAGGVPFYCAGYRHAIGAVIRDKYINDTTVNSTTGSGTEPPYARENDAPLVTCFSSQCHPETAPCGGWIGHDQTFIGQNYSWDDALAKQHYYKSGTVNFAVCRQRGFKNLAVRRFWHGRYGYKSEGGGSTIGGNDTVKGCGWSWDGSGDQPAGRKNISYSAWHNAPDTLRYLMLSATARVKGTYFGAATDFDESFTITDEVAPLSGLHTVGATGGGLNDEGNQLFKTMDAGFFSWGGTPAIPPINIANWMIGDITGRISLGDYTGPDGSSVYTTTYNTSNWFSAFADTHGHTNVIMETLTFDLVAGTLSRTVNGWAYIDPGTSDFRLTLSSRVTETIIWSNTELHWYLKEETFGPPYSSGDPSTGTLSTSLEAWCDSYLTNPETNDYTIPYMDAKSLALRVMLDDDALYPWRTDSVCQVAPLISRNEAATQLPMSTSHLIRDCSKPVGGTNRFGFQAQYDENDAAIISTFDFEDRDIDVWVDQQATPCKCGVLTFSVLSSSLSALALPPGLSLNTSTGEITGTIPAHSGYSAVCILCTSKDFDGITPAPYYDGRILGDFNPAGYQDYFNFGAENWLACPNGSTGNLEFYIRSYGQYLHEFISGTQAQLPLNCTQWTNYWQATNKMRGASLIFGAPGASELPLKAGTRDGDALWLIKWAECGERYQSQNFARPGGTDKFTLDETQTYCWYDPLIIDLGGNPVTSRTFDGIWGGPCVNGFYTGCTTDSGGTLTLGTKVYEIPTGWSTRSGDSSLAFGRLRWQSGGVSTAPSILGRAFISAVVDSNGNQPFSHAADAGQLPLGSPVDWIPTWHLSPTQPAFGLEPISHHETVDIYDASMTVLATSVTATRVSDSQFTTTVSWATAAFIQIHGAPDYKWDDNYPKGDFLTFTWLRDFRTNGEYARLATSGGGGPVYECDGKTVVDHPTLANYGYMTDGSGFSKTPHALPILPCHPSVVCFSPNAESFANGLTLDFPADFKLDGLYGSIWHGNPLFSMDDLLWQTPHLSCANCPGWSEDDGQCRADDATTCYYELPPQVEARKDLPTLPAGCPALPAGVSFGLLSPVTNNTGDVAYPPAPLPYGSSGGPALSSTPWYLMDNLCSSKDACSRFTYADWVIGCPPT